MDDGLGDPLHQKTMEAVTACKASCVWVFAIPVKKLHRSRAGRLGNLKLEKINFPASKKFGLWSRVSVSSAISRVGVLSWIRETLGGSL